MKLTMEMKEKIKDNLGLVGAVIRNRVHSIDQMGIYSYDDLFQIGCIGLCKAAYTDDGGCFSTYAYRLIWNEICNALFKANRLNSRELLTEPMSTIFISIPKFHGTDDTFILYETFHNMGKDAPGVTRKGVQALRLSADGYSSKEISRILKASPATVRMWMTKARRYLKEMPEIQELLVT